MKTMKKDKHGKPITGLIPNKFGTTLIASAMAILCCGPSFADDTEVFFGQVDRNQNNQPNVLFVLDTSGSMNNRDAQVAGNETRLERMQEAMTTILNQSDNVNVGIMRLNGSNGGGSVLYPITPIDEEICESNNCGDVQVISKISADEDDAEQRGNGSSTTGGNTLSIQTTDPNRHIGLRFNNLDIPQGATITSATIGFVARNGTPVDGTETVTIAVEDSNNAEAFSGNDFDISSRTLNTTATWQPGAWADGELYDTTDISNLVQQVVTRGDWCGGNAMAFSIQGDALREMVSYDASPSDAPVLKVTYDSTSIPVGGGCSVKYAVSTVDGSFNDAEEFPGFITNPWSQDLELFTDRGYRQVNGVRFNDLQIPRNSTILEANIEFEMDRASFGNNSAIIYGEASDSAQGFSRNRNNIGNRPKTGANVAWNNLPPLQTNDKLITPNLSNIVSEITSRNGWSSGNSMVFIMNDNGSTGKHPAESYDGDAAAAPKLVVKYESFVQPATEEPTYITARDRLLNEITGMTATGGTPIVDAYYEATQYMLGGRVDYGTERGNNRNRFHRVSHPLSYVGGTVNRPVGCSDNNLDSTECINETITGTPRYISPIESSCQTNHIVLLSDGNATSNSAVAKVEAQIGQSCARQNASGPIDSDEYCGTELAHWLANTDHSNTLSQEQTIKTYTIGFNIDHPFLQSIANNGDGRYFRADSAADLVARFQDILSDVYSTDTSFVAPGATVNQFNRLTHRNDIYFALFRPAERPTWSGNLKKYEVGLDADGKVTIFDHSTPREDAVNAEEGFFSDTAKSDWSTAVDGSNVALGGAAEQLRHKSQDGNGLNARQMYTILSSTDSIPTGGYDIRADGNLIHEDNAVFNDADLGVSPADGNVDGVEVNLENLLSWARGIDVKDEDGDGDSEEFRQHIGDPMHSRPVIVNYASGSKEPFTTIFMGTNEGVLHGINNVDGNEIFSFMPPSLLGNIKENFINSTATTHQYGLDGPMTTWTIDKNNNVVVDSNEDAMLYLGMRRGGNNYYGFDVSNRENPNLRWIIKGGEGNFENLGQSWSRMVPTKIRYQGQERHVLIFGGGYDISNDVDYSVGAVPKEVDDVGNSIFIVDALTGEKIYELSGSNSTQASQKFDAMDYAIPSDIRVMDIDGNGFADALFVGDLGGQVWRFDFDLYHASGTGNLMKGDVIAALGLPHTNVANNRRFFYEPDVALIAQNGERYLSVAIGSGWRSHPLNTDVKEGFYMLRSNDVYNQPLGYGKRQNDGTYSPVVEADLTDVSSKLDNSIGPFGWKLRFDNPGEKVLGDALTINNQVIFTTYLPESEVASCSTALGSGAVYALRVSDARPSLDLNNDGNTNIEDRSDILAHGGVPPEATALIVEDDGVITPTVLVGPEQPLDGIFSENLTERGFWVDAGMTEEGALGASIEGRD